jgi:hypothetical protein
MVLETTFFGYRDVCGGYEEPWNMWLRARRRMGGLLKGVLEEVMGSQKIFTISELSDRPDHLLLKGSLPLT